MTYESENIKKLKETLRNIIHNVPGDVTHSYSFRLAV